MEHFAHIFKGLPDVGILRPSTTKDVPITLEAPLASLQYKNSRHEQKQQIEHDQTRQIEWENLIRGIRQQYKIKVN